MKKIILNLVLVNSLVITAYAQDLSIKTTSSSLSSFTEKKSELGIFGGTQFYDVNSDGIGTVAGIQYKRWIKPNLAFKFLAGVNPYSYSRSPEILEHIGVDTIRVGYQNRSVNILFAGFGVEVQRHFYKKVFLFASLDIKGGSGSGKEQKYSTLYSIHDNRSFISNNAPDFIEKSYRRSYIKLLPNIGGKLVFDKFVFGAEMNVMNVGWIAEKSGFLPNNAFSILDLNLLTPVSYRLFFNYRF